MTVNVHLVLTPKRLREFPGLSEQAIQDALQSAVGRIKTLAMEVTPEGDPSNYGYAGTGQTPGRLKRSFKIFGGSRTLVFKWTSMHLGVDIAQIADKGRPGHPLTGPYMGWNFSSYMKEQALRILLEELAVNYAAIGG